MLEHGTHEYPTERSRSQTDNDEGRKDTEMTGLHTRLSTLTLRSFGPEAESPQTVRR